METESLLLTLAQIGLTLAGFVALVLAFRRADRVWEVTEIVGNKVILELSLGTALFALFPFAILHTLGAETVWRVSSAAYIAFMIGWIIVLSRRTRGLTASNTSQRIAIASQITMLIALGLQVGNVILWNGFAAYLWGVLWMLAFAAVQFVLFVYGYLDETQKK